MVINKDMVRKIEFLRRSEARIIVYLSNTTKLLRYGLRISEVLKIDISYTMKILRQMYNKGWIATHVYDKTTYFRLTITAPTTEAKEKITDEQTRLETKKLEKLFEGQ